MCQCARVCQSVPLCQRVATRPSSLVARPPPTSARHPPWVGRVCHFWRGIRIEMGTWHILCAYTTQGWQSDNHACAFRWLSIKFHQPQCASTHTHAHTRPHCAHSFTHDSLAPTHITISKPCRPDTVTVPPAPQTRNSVSTTPRHTSRRWRRFPRHQDQPILSTAPFPTRQRRHRLPIWHTHPPLPGNRHSTSTRRRRTGTDNSTRYHAGENSAGGRTNVAPTACRGHHGCACSMRGTFILIGMRLKESRGLAS